MKKIFFILSLSILIFSFSAQADFIPLSESSGGSGGTWSLSNISGFGLPDQGIGAIITNIVYWLLGIFSALGILGFVISGVMYLISSGDEDMADRAKNGMKFSIYGIIIGLAGFIVIRAVDYALRGYASF